MTVAPPLQPGDAWTAELAAAFVAALDRDVSAEVARLEAEMGAAFPTGRMWTFRYDAAALVRYYPSRGTLDAQPLAHVMVRPVSGGFAGATVLVPWATGEVDVRGWPDGC